ncbi:MAG: hypothetical protein HQK65_15525 [Desulfamplus sp.]|nr:hypothetical protein [Desulfamplus sp.]
MKDSLPVFIGTVNEELTDVGKVHFGVVFKIMAASPDRFSPGEELVDFQWVRTEDLLQKKDSKFHMELWSEMAMELF